MKSNLLQCLTVVFTMSCLDLFILKHFSVLSYNRPNKQLHANCVEAISVSISSQSGCVESSTLLVCINGGSSVPDWGLMPKVLRIAWQVQTVLIREGCFLSWWMTTNSVAWICSAVSPTRGTTKAKGDLDPSTPCHYVVYCGPNRLLTQATSVPQSTENIPLFPWQPYHVYYSHQNKPVCRSVEPAGLLQI